MIVESCLSLTTLIYEIRLVDVDHVSSNDIVLNWGHVTNAIADTIIEPSV